MDRIDRRIARQAAAQHGLITFDQALLAGLGRHQIKQRTASGQWEPLHRGVYRLAGAPATWEQQAMAACLGAPTGAVVSHLTAAALAGLDVPVPPLPHLTVGRGRSVRFAGAVVHTARLSLGHVTDLRGVPATTVGRTIIDCAGVLGPNRLGRLTNQAIHRKLLCLDQVSELWDHARRAPGRHGEVRLREVLEPWVGPITPDSPAEARLRRKLVEWGYPEPELQIPVRDEHGRVVASLDAGWSPRRLGIEYDSPEFHDPSRWQADEARHRLVESLGWTLLHADKLDLQPGAGALQASLRRAWAATSGVPAR